MRNSTMVKSVRRFNTALEALVKEFHLRFQRRLSVAEVRKNPKEEVWYGRQPCDIRIAYCPPHSYAESYPHHLLHVRIYNPDRYDPQAVAELLKKRLGFKPDAGDNDPWGSWDVNVRIV